MRLLTEAEGYWYGSNYGHGITVFEIDPPQTTSKDEIAFGFMTWSDDGKLLRVDGDASSGHFIEARLVQCICHFQRFSQSVNQSINT